MLELYQIAIILLYYFTHEESGKHINKYIPNLLLPQTLINLTQSMLQSK